MCHGNDCIYAQYFHWSKESFYAASPKNLQVSNYVLLANSQPRKILIAVNHGGLRTMIWRKRLTVCRHTRQRDRLPLARGSSLTLKTKKINWYDFVVVNQRNKLKFSHESVFTIPVMINFSWWDRQVSLSPRKNENCRQI